VAQASKLMLQRKVLQIDGPRAPVVSESDETENGNIRRQDLVIVLTTGLAMAACVMYPFVVEIAGPKNS
jgi:hypothetical protein